MVLVIALALPSRQHVMMQLHWLHLISVRPSEQRREGCKCLFMSELSVRSVPLKDACHLGLAMLGVRDILRFAVTSRDLRPSMCPLSVGRREG